MTTKKFKEVLKEYGNKAPKMFECFEINHVVKLTPTQKKIVKRMEAENGK